MRRLRGLLAHKNPNMKTSELIDELCEIALETLDPIRKAARVLRAQRPKIKKTLSSQKQVGVLTPVAVQKQIAAQKIERQNGENKSLSNTVCRAPAIQKYRQYISVKTKLEVWKESDGKCSNCKSDFALQTDHVQPVALGGSCELKNYRLLCRSCNQRAAIVKLGQKTMDRYLNGYLK